MQDRRIGRASAHAVPVDDALRMVTLYESRYTGWTVTHFLSSHLKTLPKPESLRHLQLSSRFGWSLANLVALLCMTLLTHRDLMAWLDEPFTPLPHQQDNPQALLAFA